MYPCLLYQEEPIDDYMNLMHDDLATDMMYSLNDIPFDDEQVKDVDNLKVIEQPKPLHIRNEVRVLMLIVTMISFVYLYALWLVLITTYDMQAVPTTPIHEMVKNQAYSNVVGVNDKPCLDTVFSERNLDEEKRKRKAKKTTNWYLRSVRTRQKKFIVSLDSVSMQPDPCTPQRPRVTRASVRRKASTSPIVIADVKHCITFIMRPETV